MNRTVALGAFVLGALVILGIAIFLIGEKEFAFIQTFRLYSDFDNVAGLINGSQVRAGGVPIGTVQQIDLPVKPGGKVRVVMNIRNSARKVIRKDSVVSILTEGLLGNKYVSISFGSGSTRQVDNGDVLRSHPPIDFSDLVAKTSTLLDDTETSVKNVEQATSDLRSIAQKIDQGQGTMGSLVNNRQVYEDLNRTVAQAQQGATAFNENMQALKKNWLFHGFYKERGYTDPSELTRYEVSRLPDKPEDKKFTFKARDIFDKPDTAKIKNQKQLDTAGEYLQKNNFSLAVVVAYSPATGEKEKDLQVTQAQAMVVRQFLLDHFQINDDHLGTKGMGKIVPGGADGRVEILVYR